ncbi:MAG: hypothetical protein M0Z44_06595 [Gammaproteobacteria bacterium]|nr:hypothetical protein [Gammaproteobacteria bacterium]
MSVMCKKKGSCCATRGLCVHEKMMMALIILMLVAAGHWGLHWF